MNNVEARATSVQMRDGKTWPALGIGTWRMGESAARRRAEIAAVRAAIEIGYRVIDTAEMYGDGNAEKIVGAAIAESLGAGTVRRDDLFVVSKVYPQNASATGTIAACERSLERLGLRSIDAYLLHWRGSSPLSETIGAFETLRRDGRIRQWGVSNFDLDDMRALVGVEGGERCAINQIYYSLTARGPAFDLLPWQAERGIVTMAYSPIDQGELVRHAGLRTLAQRLRVSSVQLALAWVAAQANMLAIPKASSVAHLKENFASTALRLAPEDMAQLDTLFPPPTRQSSLAMR